MFRVYNIILMFVIFLFTGNHPLFSPAPWGSPGASLKIHAVTYSIDDFKANAHELKAPKQFDFMVPLTLRAHLKCADLSKLVSCYVSFFFSCWAL